MDWCKCFLDSSELKQHQLSINDSGVLSVIKPSADKWRIESGDRTPHPCGQQDDLSDPNVTRLFSATCPISTLGSSLISSQSLESPGEAPISLNHDDFLYSMYHIELWGIFRNLGLMPRFHVMMISSKIESDLRESAHYYWYSCLSRDKRRRKKKRKNLYCGHEGARCY